MALKVENKKLTFAEIAAKTQGERYTLYKTSVSVPFDKVKNARDMVTTNLHTAMKVTAQLKRDYTRLMNSGELAADTSEAKFFENYCGGDVPARVKQLATFSNAMGLETATPMIPEAIADAHSINTLEKAAPIIALERKRYSAGEAWKTTAFTLEVIDALTTPGEATKKLADIRKRQSPKEEETEAENTPTSTLVLMLKNRIKEATDDDHGYAVFVACQELAETWPLNKLIPADRYGAWMTRREQAAKPIIVMAPGAEATETPAVKTPDEIAAEELAAEELATAINA